ncbi:hypothetical protein CVT25_005808 [Psilocybe cyanescens]|uniref:Uncharacterized protein n=1 Tax=Psilocybe cyanescens TaxID=93625 RepID=A0A409X9Y6_PSICY|nr:hypothetical protein CVT25_005808 [Psilocybe cyanescens]
MSMYMSQTSDLVLSRKVGEGDQVGTSTTFHNSSLSSSDVYQSTWGNYYNMSDWHVPIPTQLLPRSQLSTYWHTSFPSYSNCGWNLPPYTPSLISSISSTPSSVLSPPICVANNEALVNEHAAPRTLPDSCPFNEAISGYALPTYNDYLPDLVAPHIPSTPLAPPLVIVIPESTIEELRQAGLYKDPINVDKNRIVPVLREPDETPPYDQTITTSFPSGGEAEKNYNHLSTNAGHCVDIRSGAGGPVELVYSVLNSDGSGEGDTSIGTQRDGTRIKSPTAGQKGKKHCRRVGPKYRVMGPEPISKAVKARASQKTRIPVMMQGQAVKALPPSTDGLNFHCMAPWVPSPLPMRDEICQQSAFKVSVGINNAKFYNHNSFKYPTKK